MLQLVLILLTTTLSVMGQGFPADLPGTHLGQFFPLTSNGKNFENSGMSMDDQKDIIHAVSDSGIVVSMDPFNGTIYHQCNLVGDFEAVTKAFSSEFIYVAVEVPETILELNPVTCQIQRSFDLSSFLSVSDIDGIEALAFWPNASSIEGGNFIIGMQPTGEIVTFELPITSSATSTAVTLIQRKYPSCPFSGSGGSCGVDISDAVVTPDGRLMTVWDSQMRGRIFSYPELVEEEYFDLIYINTEAIAISVKYCWLFLGLDRVRRSEPVDRLLIRYDNWTGCHQGRGSSISVTSADPVSSATPVSSSSAPITSTATPLSSSSAPSSEDPRSSSSVPIVSSASVCDNVVCTGTRQCSCDSGQCCLPVGSACQSNGDCCTGKCNGNPSSCKGKDPLLDQC